jgi:hypothetical protein
MIHQALLKQKTFGQKVFLDDWVLKNIENADWTESRIPVSKVINVAANHAMAVINTFFGAVICFDLDFKKKVWEIKTSPCQHFRQFFAIFEDRLVGCGTAISDTSVHRIQKVYDLYTGKELASQVMDDPIGNLTKVNHFCSIEVGIGGVDVWPNAILPPIQINLSKKIISMDADENSLAVFGEGVLKIYDLKSKGILYQESFEDIISCISVFGYQAILGFANGVVLHLHWGEKKISPLGLMVGEICQIERSGTLLCVRADGGAEFSPQIAFFDLRRRKLLCDEFIEDLKKISFTAGRALLAKEMEILEWDFRIQGSKGSGQELSPEDSSSPPPGYGSQSPADSLQPLF